ncbi:hypothetical protein [Halalkalibacter akibai]|uniref:Uncharacterized protein n=1 Tax=Halalkalibacter akibai (strain ATCC 43226 / DSM 21942 / CIP 109018 / JCM 9157 / 1139) TaxID=1236973 RepID=W4QRE6_HALA3|nr:hypothetical protein [Halalkalibacter akibai]GAE34487.1 hypothetical protein JCM9157_1547 [Halalkalibacter akibai JCM 9157]
MTKKGTTGIQRGQAITFRLPSDTPDHIIKQLQKLKETERRNFSSKIAEFTIEGVSNTLTKERETVTIPLPRQLSKEQRSWLKHSHSESLLGSIIYQLLCDPVRATSVLAALNSNSFNIDEALYLQENQDLETEEVESDYTEDVEDIFEEEIISKPKVSDDDLMNFDWGKVKDEVASTREEEEADSEEDGEDLLGDFLAQMNK